MSSVSSSSSKSSSSSSSSSSESKPKDSKPKDASSSSSNKPKDNDKPKPSGGGSQPATNGNAPSESGGGDDDKKPSKTGGASAGFGSTPDTLSTEPKVPWKGKDKPPSLTGGAEAGFGPNPGTISSGGGTYKYNPSTGGLQEQPPTPQPEPYKVTFPNPSVSSTQVIDPIKDPLPLPTQQELEQGVQQGVQVVQNGAVAAYETVEQAVVGAYENVTTQVDASKLAQMGPGDAKAINMEVNLTAPNPKIPGTNIKVVVKPNLAVERNQDGTFTISVDASATAGLGSGIAGKEGLKIPGVTVPDDAKASIEGRLGVGAKIEFVAQTPEEAEQILKTVVKQSLVSGTSAAPVVATAGVAAPVSQEVGSITADALGLTAADRQQALDSISAVQVSGVAAMRINAALPSGTSVPYGEMTPPKGGEGIPVGKVNVGTGLSPVGVLKVQKDDFVRIEFGFKKEELPNGQTRMVHDGTGTLVTGERYSGNLLMGMGTDNRISMGPATAYLQSGNVGFFKGAITVENRVPLGDLKSMDALNTVLHDVTSGVAPISLPDFNAGRVQSLKVSGTAETSILGDAADVFGVGDHGGVQIKGSITLPHGEAFNADTIQKVFSGDFRGAADQVQAAYLDKSEVKLDIRGYQSDGVFTVAGAEVKKGPSKFGGEVEMLVTHKDVADEPIYTYEGSIRETAKTITD
jgi:hypothetical protein